MDGKQREALQRIRDLFKEVMPLLAATESLLDVPDDERLAGTEWIKGKGDGNGRARPGQDRRGR